MYFSLRDFNSVRSFVLLVSSGNFMSSHEIKLSGITGVSSKSLSDKEISFIDNKLVGISGVSSKVSVICPDLSFRVKIGSNDPFSIKNYR